MRILIFCLFTLLSFNSYSQGVYVYGQCYYDVNGNYTFDGIDSAIANRIVSATGSGNSAALTNSTGQYNLFLPITGFYNFVLTGSVDIINYKRIYPINRYYNFPTSDNVSFIFQKKDSIESIKTYITPNSSGGLTNSGGTRTYTIKYGYDGSLPSIPATLSLRFNPRLSLVSTSLPTYLNSSGLLQWNFSNLNRNANYNAPYDSIVISLNYPTIGDTIGNFILSPNVIPNIFISKAYSISNTPYEQKINHPQQPLLGPSSSVKWIRQYARFNVGTSNQFGFSIDTTQDGNNYFVAGMRRNIVAPILTDKIYVGKLNKDGLSVWEKNIDIIQGSYKIKEVWAIKHTSDGGCLVSGTCRDSLDINKIRLVVFRLDNLGNFIWRKILTSTSTYMRPGKDIVLISDGSFIVASHTDAIDGDFNTNNNNIFYYNNMNIFIHKFSPNGDIIFTRKYGGTGDDYIYSLTALQNGTFVILGVTSSNNGDVTGAHEHLQGDNGFGSSQEAWVININTNGGIIWNRCYGGKKSSLITGAIDNNGGILLTGTTDSKDGDLPYYPERKVTLWTLQVSATNGEIIWSKLHKMYKGYEDTNYVKPPDFVYEHYNDNTEFNFFIGGTGFENYLNTGLQKTSDGNFIIGSVTSDKYGAIKTKHNAEDIAFTKINPTGDIVWQKNIGGSKVDIVNDFILDRNDDIIFTGSTMSGDDDFYQDIYTPPNASNTKLLVVGKLGITNIIKGQVFIDNNNNHIKDAGEIFYSQGQIKSVKGTDTITARIFNGKFLNNVDTGNYVSTYKPTNNYFTIYPASKNTNFTTFDMKDSVDFALTPIPGINDLEIQILPLSTPRPGFPVTYRVITKNVGPSNLNNVVIGFKKDSRQLYNSASRTATGILVDSIWWGPFTLNAFTNDTLYTNFTLKAPPLLNNADTITNTVTANPVIGDYTIPNNKATLKEVVRGSFDPNDKKESHGGTFTTTQYASGDYLEYLIRFQNTGTDTAFFVTVKDTLQQKLDLNTLEIISSSHPFTFSLEGQVATWDFKKILLPDSASNQVGSNGFILFRVKPKAGLIVGDIFTNKAAIYFDFNLPVITNEDNTLLGNKNSTCPNGNITFESGLVGTTYQWQVNDGNGYIDLSNGGIYSDVTNSVLRVSNMPTSLRGYKYRCLVNGNNYSPENLIKFEVKWTGAINTAWENPSNWDCGVLPDNKTDVIIPSSIRYPLVGIAGACYSLQLAPSSSVNVKTGFTLLIAGSSGF
jgi:hypothetical protein